jgi:ubiquinone/menaquinone biosynthesis C-methylase UbiE
MMVVFPALQDEYRIMAPWYDRFWKCYLDKTFEKPLDLVQCSINRLVSKVNNNNKGIVVESTTVITVVDVGCGTGEFLNRFKHQQQQQQHPQQQLLDKDNTIKKNHISRYDTTTKLCTDLILYGVEPSHEMLQQAKKKKKQTSQSAGIFWKQAAAEELPLDDLSVDVVVSTNAFHFFVDQRKALSEMYRVSKDDDDDDYETIDPNSNATNDASSTATTSTKSTATFVGSSCPSLIITDWCADYWLVRWYHFKERWWWNYWKGYQEEYPSPLPSTTMKRLVEEAGFANVSVTTYQVRVFYLFYWGMQTVTATKKIKKMVIPGFVCLL